MTARGSKRAFRKRAILCLELAGVRVVSCQFFSRDHYLSTFCLLTRSRISGVVLVQPDAGLNFWVNLKIAHLRIGYLVGNPEVGNPDP